MMAGLSYEDALDATPKEIDAYIKAWSIRTKFEGWVYGQYIQAAIACALTGKNVYPDNPINGLGEEIDDDADWTEEELDYYRKLAMLQALSKG